MSETGLKPKCMKLAETSMYETGLKPKSFRKADSFECIAFAYNDLYVGQDWMLKSDTGALILDRRRLAEAWYKRAFISMKQRNCDESEIEFITSDHLENMLEKHVDQLWTSFTKDWSSHTDSCNHKGEQNIIYKCKKTPAAGSIYCKKHANTVTKENPSNEDIKCRDEQVDDLRCNTRKDICLVEKNKTSGICAAVYNCGIIVGVTELFGFESLSQLC
ncbi:unnamed protein product [Mytilus coruscus]|uniref:Uncharacterized protein n=1 Tax=Mytilus coruscus TaxID=42192 RepID=A0A6J8AJ38_MYTCO|nr:unnamed protein product [Mytilus coruscus]